MYIFDKDIWYGKHAVVIEEITFKLSDDREISVNGRCLDDADTEEISVAIEARYYKGM